MTLKIIQSRLESYPRITQEEEQFAIKEIAQEIALAGLSRTDFFKKAAFQGGTALRVLYGLSRFSEDLDFALDKSNPKFLWLAYLQSLKVEFAAYGFDLEVIDKSKVGRSVKVGWLKDDSRGGLLNLRFRTDTRMKMIKIKLEIDTNPPQSAGFEMKYLDFPFVAAIKAHDLATLFAGKCHALLCRPSQKGRDWFDFVWYVSKGVSPNLKFLSSALALTGPWKDKGIVADEKWFLCELQKKIKSVDIDGLKKDVKPFLRGRELESLSIWSVEFFLDRIVKLERCLD